MKEKSSLALAALLPAFEVTDPLLRRIWCAASHTIPPLRSRCCASAHTTPPMRRCADVAAPEYGVSIDGDSLGGDSRAAALAAGYGTAWAVLAI
jgi:hypothetical protein